MLELKSHGPSPGPGRFSRLCRCTAVKVVLRPAGASWELPTKIRAQRLLLLGARYEILSM